MLLSIFTGLVLITFLVILSLFIGRYCQNRWSITKDNQYLSFGIGFGIYLPFLSLPIMIPVYFALPGISLVVVWWLINCAFIVFLVLNRKYLAFKEIKWKQWISIGLGAIFILIVSRFINYNIKDSDNFFYSPWVKFNAYTDHINHGFGNKLVESGIYWSQGWYYFQSAILRTSGMDQNFMNFWLFGTLVSFLAASVTMGIVFSIIERDSVLINVATCGFALVPIALLTNGEQDNVGSTILPWFVGLLLVLTINYVYKPNLALLSIICLASFAGWTVSSSALFVNFIFFVGVFFTLIFKKSKHTLMFLIIICESLILMLMFYCIGNKFIFILLAILAIGWISLIILSQLSWKRFWQTTSLLVSKYRYLIFCGTFSVVFIASFAFWAKNGFDSWLHFKYDADGMRAVSSSSGMAFYIFLYSAYWIIAAYLLLNLFWNWRRGFKNNKLNYFLVSVAFSLILFYNPVVASLWNGPIIPTVVYHRLRFNVFMPICLLLPLILAKFKWNVLKKLSCIAIPVVGVTVILVPFLVKENHRNVLSLYTGVPKGIEEVAEFVNKTPNAAITGDINGIYPYTNNPMALDRFDEDYQKLLNNVLTDSLYNSISIIDKGKIDILIKSKNNVDKNFNWHSHGFSTVTIKGEFEIFAK